MPRILKSSNSVISFKENFQNSTSCHCLYIMKFILWRYSQNFCRERFTDWKTMLATPRWAAGELKLTETSYPSKCVFRRVNILIMSPPVKSANWFFQYIILFDPDHKIRHLELYKQYFMSRYNELDPCTWRLICGCKNCRDLKKLHKWTKNTADHSVTRFYANPCATILNLLLILLLFSCLINSFSDWHIIMLRKL